MGSCPERHRHIRCVNSHPGDPCQPKTCPAGCNNGGCQAGCTGRLMNPLQHASAAVTNRMTHECMHTHTQHAVLRGGETVEASSGRLLRPTRVRQVQPRALLRRKDTHTATLSLNPTATAVTVNHAQHTHSPCNQPPCPLEYPCPHQARQLLRSCQLCRPRHPRR